MSDAIGDVPNATPEETFAAIEKGGNVLLVDVRTTAEWAYVGLPDLSAAGAEPVLIEWQKFPDMAVDPRFGEMLEAMTPDKSTELYFLCRSGVRSLAAAREMRARGYDNVYNISDGFEGPPDGSGHRGNVAGWKASGLPWRQR